jgi:hypothetical protein
MPSVESDPSLGQMGDAVRVLVHSQVHAPTREGRLEYGHGVRLMFHSKSFHHNAYIRTLSSFEDALLHQYANPVMTDILTRFILNLRSGTRNIKCVLFSGDLSMYTYTKRALKRVRPGLLNETLAGVLAEHLKTSEMTVFWNDALLKNVNPLTKATHDFFVLEWDTKVR